MHLPKLLPRCAILLGLSMLLLGCPGPNPSLETLGEVHLLDLDRGKMVAIRETAMVTHGEGASIENKSLEIVPSTLQPPVALVSPKTILVSSDPYSGQPRWAFFLEVPEGVPSFTAYRFNYSGQTFDGYTRKTGPILHPGGRLNWVPANPALGFTYLAWGTEAPYLVGYRAELDGALSTWPNLPELAAAPAGLALNGNLLCIADATGKVEVYRLEYGVAPVPLHGLAAAGPVRKLEAYGTGLLVLRESPASLDLHPLDTTGLGDSPLASYPVVGTPLDLGYSGGEFLVTSGAPQALTRFGSTDGRLEQRSLRVAIRGDFAVHRTFSWPMNRSGPRVLLDGARGQGIWLGDSIYGTEDFLHFSLPPGHYAPVQVSWN